MDIVKEMAIDFAENKYDYIESIQDFIDELETELYRYNSSSDKLNFISTIRDYIRKKYDEHYESCKDRDRCGELKDYNKVLYFLKNLSENHGIKIENKDLFSDIEKLDYNNKLDQILNDLFELKKGQELIYDDLYVEIEDLKKLYFLGKKNWKQLLAGKTIEMVTGGIISETVSKKLINLTGIVTNNLLN